MALETKNPYDHQTLGALYLQTRQNEKALEELKKALALEPDDPLTQFNQAKTLIALQRIKEAMPLLQELSKTPDPSISNEAQALLMSYS